MLVRTRLACLSAAVIATLYGGSQVQARDLLWDASGNSAATGGTHGSGTWDNASSNWIDQGTGSQTSFNSATPDSARFGLNIASPAYSADPHLIFLGTNITVQDLRFAGDASGRHYVIVDQGDGNQTLTLNGNILKIGAGGAPRIQLTSSLNLSAGNHVIATRDSPGGDRPELSFDSPLGGAGSLTIDNTFGGSGYEQWGTVGFNADSSYAGGTTVSSGRLVLKTGGGLSTGLAVVSNAGMVSFGGAGITTGTFNAGGDLGVSTPFQITRSDYGSSDAFSRYTEAVVATNDGSRNTITLGGAIDVASTDARIAAESNRIILAGPLTTSTGTGVLSLGGDFAGYIALTQNNTAFGNAGGAIRIRGGVEVEASSEANLGGPTSTLYLAGGTIRPGGSLGAAGSPFMTNFGAHVIANNSVSTGVNLDAGQVFNVNSLSGGGVGTRGTGTINFGGTNVFTGTTFFDGGTANFLAGSTTSVGAIGLRSPVVNIAGAVTTTTGTNRFGADTFGTNGGPDIAVVNLTGSGSLTQATNNDFNISDAANTRGTVNIGDNATFTAAGLVHVGRGLGAVGTINQTGGTININRNGNFAFILGRDNGQGVYNLSGGAFNAAGEVYVGQGRGTGLDGKGNWNQTGGVATISNWFVIGREGGAGYVDVSGGSLIKRGGGNVPIGEGNNARGNSFSVRGTGTFDAQTGEVWVSNGLTPTVMNVQDSGVVNGNNWFVVGRFGGSDGTLNVSGNATITKAGVSPFVVAAGGGSRGVVNQTGGTINVTNNTETWIGDGGIATWNLSGGAVNAGVLDVGHNGGDSGTLNVSGTAALTAATLRIGEAGSVVGTLNLNGGTVAANQVIGRTSSGAKTFNFNGGTLQARVDNAAFMSGLTTANVRAGGAKIDSNGRVVTIAQALVHDAALGGTVDGGLTKSGAGTVNLTAASTYTGATLVSGGTLGVNQLSAATASYTTNSGTTLKLLNVDSAANLSGRSTIDQSRLVNNGVLDVGETGVTINGTSEASVRSQIIAGRNNGTWTGTTGITSSNAAANGRQVGYTVNGSSVTAAYAASGDTDLNRIVDTNDVIAIYVAGKLDTGAPANWSEGDFNYDNVANTDDVIQIYVEGSLDAGPYALRGAASEPSRLVGPNPGNAKLIYNPENGNIKIDTSGLTLTTFNLQDVIAGDGDLFSGSTEPTFPANASSTINNDTKVSYGSFAGGFTGIADLGNIALLGKTYADLVATLAGPAGSTATIYTRAGAAGANNFDLIIAGANVPEPASLAALTGLGVLVLGRRRRGA